MKGFYFSLDSILAASIILGMMVMLAGYTQPEQRSRSLELDMLRTSTVQEVSEWNSSYDSSRTVLNYIYASYFQGDSSEAAEVCRSYFKTRKASSLYIVSEEDQQRVCGDLDVSENSDFESSSAILPAIRVNGTLLEPREAVMVVED